MRRLALLGLGNRNKRRRIAKPKPVVECEPTGPLDVQPEPDPIFVSTEHRKWLFERFALGTLSAEDVCVDAYALRNCPDAGGHIKEAGTPNRIPPTILHEGPHNSIIMLSLTHRAVIW